MSNIEITLTGPDNTFVAMHNDWDECEARGLLHIEDLEGWYGGVQTSITPDLNRFRRHGKFPGKSIRGARKLDLTLTWNRSISSEPDAYTAYARWASGIAWDMGPYQMRVVEDGFALNSEVVLDGEPSFQPINGSTEASFRFRIPLRAADPFIYGDPKQITIDSYGTRPVVMPQGFTGNMQNADGQQVLPWSVPSVRTPVLRNNGTADAFPLFVVQADSPSGVRLTLNGKSVEYGAAMHPSSPVTIDYRTGSATVNGRDQSAALRLRGWTQIPPGDQAIPRMALLSTSGTGFANCILQDTYI